MIDLNISLNLANIARFRRLLAVSRTMAAKSLTFVAQKAVPEWRVGHRVFHKRSTWIDRGVRLRAATPATLQARVGSLDRFMGRHVVGVNERKQGRLYIPLYRKIGEARTHTRERTVLKRMESTQRKPFRIRFDGADWLARRKGKRSFPLVILGKMQTGAEVEPRLDARRIVGGVVNREFPKVYSRLLLAWAERGKV